MATRIEASVGTNGPPVGFGDNCKCNAECTSDVQTEHEPVKAMVVLRPGVEAEGVDRIIALTCAGSPGSKVYLKYVIDMDPMESLYLDQAYFDGLRRQAERAAEPAVEKLQSAGLEVEVLRPYFGIAAEEILRAEKQVHPNVIVMDIPHHTLLQRSLARDFSQRVIGNARATVLTINHTRDDRTVPHSESAIESVKGAVSHWGVRVALFIGAVLALWAFMARGNSEYWDTKHLVDYSDWGALMAISMIVLWGIVTVGAIVLAWGLTQSRRAKSVSTQEIVR